MNAQYFEVIEGFCIEADYADDLPLLANTPAHAESLLHSQEQAARGIAFAWAQQKKKKNRVHEF